VFLLVALATMAAACSGPLVIDPVDTLRHPETGPPILEVVILAGDDLSPLGNASLLVQDAEVEVSSEGVATFPWVQGGLALEAGAPGFRNAPAELDRFPEAGRIEFRLDPVVLAGRVTTPDGTALPGATVVLAGVPDETDAEGRFLIERAIPGEIQLSRPGWEDGEHRWDGASERIDVAMEPLVLKAFRVGGDRAGDASAWSELLALADLTVINAVVVDIKDESGTVLHDTEVGRAHEIGAVKAFYDLGEVVAGLDDHELYKVARIVVFQDSNLAAAEPDHAVLNEGGGLWETYAGQHWLDPTDLASFEYAVDLAEEACNRGFDEIQFDYVTFPFGGDISQATFDAAYTEEVRVASINTFLERAYTVLSPSNCAVGSTVLAITLESSSDEGIGQRPGAMSRTVDVLSPMIYTTNYGAGWKGFEDPNAHAVAIADEALRAGERKLEGFAYYRPWFQTWAIAGGDVLDVQSVAEDLNMGWMLWSNASSYPADMLPSS
jgi:hypothetical protein